MIAEAETITLIGIGVVEALPLNSSWAHSSQKNPLKKLKKKPYPPKSQEKLVKLLIANHRMTVIASKIRTLMVFPRILSLSFTRLESELERSEHQWNQHLKR